jgi:hypothetical protein
VAGGNGPLHAGPCLGVESVDLSRPANVGGELLVQLGEAGDWRRVPAATMAWSLVEDLVGQAVDGLPVVQGLAAVVRQVLVADVAPSDEPGALA